MSAAEGPSSWEPRHEEPGVAFTGATARVRTRDGLDLHVRSWVPPEPRAAVAIVHGLAEHADRYAALSTWLAARGFACHAVDCRGHGRSPGPSVHVDSFGEYATDAAAVRAHARAAHPDLPLFLLGHSQGGLIAMLSVLRDPEDLAGLAVTSPNLAVHPSLRPGPVLGALTRMLLRVAPSLLLPFGAPPALVSRQASVVAAYLADPLVSRKVSAGWYRAGEIAQAEVLAAAAQWKQPTLVMVAGADRLVDAETTQAWVDRAPADLVSFVPWPSLYHELFNEPERYEVYEALLKWLEKRLSSGLRA